MKTESGTALAALSIEARRRGITYGQLAAGLSREEARRIIEDYAAGKKRRRKQGLPQSLR